MEKKKGKKKTWGNFLEVEVTLPHHLQGMKFLICQERFQQIQTQIPKKKKLPRSAARELAPHPSRPPRAPIFPLLKPEFFCFFCFFSYRVTISVTSGLRAPLVLIWKINSHYRQDRKKDESEKKERLLSLPVWPCLSAVISLNCFANIIPTQCGSGSEKLLGWSRLEAPPPRALSRCLFLPLWPFRPLLVQTPMMKIQAQHSDSCSEMTQDWIIPNLIFIMWQIFISGLYSTLGVESGLPELTFVFPSGDARCAFSQSWNGPGIPLHCRN